MCKLHTWRSWSSAHGLEVLWGGLTEVRGRMGVARRRSAGILGWGVTVGAHFGPWGLSRFPRCLMRTSFLMTDWSPCSTWRCRGDYITHSNQHLLFHVILWLSCLFYPIWNQCFTSATTTLVLTSDAPKWKFWVETETSRCTWLNTETVFAYFKKR